MADTGGTLSGGGLIDGGESRSEFDLETHTGLTPEDLRVQPSEIGLAGGGGCTTAPGLTWTFVLVWLFRALFLFPLVAHGADFQHLQTLEGGRFVSVRSTDPGPLWSGRVTLTGQHASQPLTVLMDDGSRRVLVSGLTTGELGATLNLGDIIGVGAALPWHEAGSNVERGPGDVAMWLMLPLERLGSPLAVRVGHERPARGDLEYWQDTYWGGRATTVTFSGEHGLGAFTLGWHSGLRFQPTDTVRGLTVGNRIEGAVGMHRAFGDRVGASLEWFGNGPLGLPKTVRELPMEALISARYRVVGQVSLTGGVGIGLTRAAGTPGSRFTLGVTIAGHAPRDADGDGIRNLIDRCTHDPEDLDGFEDRDGCPEPDNDLDGLLDPEDACPDIAEVFNDYRDDDGCPDALARWTVHVAGPEVFKITHEEETYEHLAGETWTVKAAPGLGQITIEADGFHTEKVTAQLDEGNTNSRVRLEPILTGQLMVQVIDANGALVPEATLEIESEPVPLEGGWYSGVHTTGRVNLIADASGWARASTHVIVTREAITTVQLELVEQEVFLDGREIHMDESPQFALDSDRLTDTEWLDALARWLRNNPDVLKVRVEGHADSMGNSGYNLELSERRADVVMQGLLERGIAADRLVAVGSGEALTWSGPERMVSFTVLVHAKW